MTSIRFIKAGHLTLRFAVDGPPDGEPLVFIHALGCDLDLWERVAATLSVRHRVLRYDLRGHGLSDVGPPECTVEDHARDLAESLGQLGVGSATIAGASLGGLVAQSFALQNPARVRRLILCSSGARIGSHASWSERIALVKSKGMEGVADAVLSRWFAPDFAAREPALFRGCRNRLARTPAEGYIASCAALRDADLREASARIASPALVISGECDVAAPPDLGRELAKLLPRASFEMIRGAGHLAPLENPAAVLSLLESVLSSQP